MFTKAAVITSFFLFSNGIMVQSAAADTVTRGATDFAVQSSFAPDTVPYDPVARAIALGLSPEWMDAAIDRALAEAEECPAGVATDAAPISCLGKPMGQPLT